MLSKFLSRSFFNFAHICKTPSEAIHGMKDGDYLLAGGFGLCGIPMNLINAVREAGHKNLTIASDGFGRGDLTGKHDWGLGVLLPTRQVKRAIVSFIGTNKRLEH
jgi:acyl CoA:acetate/3-ketoacid CoA transferase alpha subunit